MAQGPASASNGGGWYNGVQQAVLETSTGYAGPTYGRVIWFRAIPTAVVNGVRVRFDHWVFAIYTGTQPVPGAVDQLELDTTNPYSVSVPFSVLSYWSIRFRAEYVYDSGGGAEKYNVVTACNPSGVATTTGDGSYEQNSSCTINTTVKAANKDKYKFVCWKSSNGDEVKTERHTFTVTSDITWVAQYAKIEHSGLVIYNPSNNQVIHSPQTNHVMYDANPDS